LCRTQQDGVFCVNDDIQTTRQIRFCFVRLFVGGSRGRMGAGAQPGQNASNFNKMCKTGGRVVYCQISKTVQILGAPSQTLVLHGRMGLRPLAGTTPLTLLGLGVSRPIIHPYLQNPGSATAPVSLVDVANVHCTILYSEWK